MESRPTTNPSKRTAIHGMTGYSERNAPSRTGSYSIACSGTGNHETSSNGCSSKIASATGMRMRLDTSRSRAVAMMPTPMHVSTMKE